MTTENSIPETPPPAETPAGEPIGATQPVGETPVAEPPVAEPAAESVTEPVGEQAEEPASSDSSADEMAASESAETEEPESEPVPAEPTSGEADASPAPETSSEPPPSKPKRSRSKAAAEEPASDEAKTEPTGPVNENMRWYVVKVQSGREETIRDAIERRVKIEGLQDCFGQILIPVENYTEMVGGKRKVKKRKLYPGYMMVNLEFNDRMLYLFRETSGVGDFVGGGLNKPPQPMSPDEVTRMIRKNDPAQAPVAPTKSKFEKGERVAVKDGTFAGMEGEVKEVIEAKGVLRVELTIFGRPVPVELEYWQVDYA